MGIGNDFEATLHQIVTDTRHEIDELVVESSRVFVERGEETCLQTYWGNPAIRNDRGQLR